MNNQIVTRFTVIGLPGPQGSKKYVGHRKNKATGRSNAVMVESSKKVRPWRELVEAAAERAWHGKAPLDEPLIVSMVFTLPKPVGAPRTRRTWPDRMPDLSKLARSTEDALTTAGLWKDDARAVEYSRLAKVYPNEDRDAMPEPGVRIEIYRMVAP